MPIQIDFTLVPSHLVLGRIADTLMKAYKKRRNYSEPAHSAETRRATQGHEATAFFLRLTAFSEGSFPVELREDLIVAMNEAITTYYDKGS